MEEGHIEQKFRKAVKQEGGTAYKFVSPGNSGVPDRIVCLPGGHVGFVELKAPGKKPTKLQKRQIAKLNKLGFAAFVLDNSDDIPCAIQRILEHPLCSQGSGER